MKYFFIILLLFSGSFLHAQLNEDFSDGNYTTNPVWAGSSNLNDFVIIDNKLRSNSNVANSGFVLSTENSLAINVQWEFWVNLQFSTSGSNYVDIYVISDKADLKSTLINGFFIRIGHTDDEISLYRRSGTTASSLKIIDGVNGAVGSSNNTIKIRLKRDSTGKFTLEREVVSNSSSYFTEGTVNDLTHTTSTHFGISIQQSTASFFFKHFFDNIKISSIVVDTVPPIVSAVSNIDSNTLAVIFNEEIDSVSAKFAANYSLNNNGGPISRVLTTNDPSKFHLKLVKGLNSGTYIISVTNVKDKNGNVINKNSTGTFTYTKPFKAKFGDVVINEIFADPTPQIDLPSVEFLELRNNTTHTLTLKNWKFSDSGSSATFGEITIEPGSFLIVCAKADTAEFKSYGKVLGLSPWPSLNNSGELIKLSSPENLLIDSIRYADTWYRSAVKKQGGWTIERKHPGIKCQGSLNWFASQDTTGGTPGRKNSIYVAGYDTSLLVADSIKQLSDTTLKIYFNKHLNSSTILVENFVLNPNTSEARKIIADHDFKELEITYDRKFLAGTNYNLLLKNLKDCHGVLISSGTQELIFKTNQPPPPIREPADTARIIITEIFADPSPEVRLPLVEFIEIHNPSKDTIDLDRWSLNDPTTKATIRAQRILPEEYITLCPVADTIQYKSFGKTIGISPWPSLNNSSDQIVLKSFKNRVVDSVAYSDTWYRNNLKKQGGWSIEKINLSSVCEGLFNWTASIDTNGGTPGKINSVNISGYDRLELKADSLKLLSDSTIKLFFNKYLNAASLIPENFSLTPINSVKKITSDVLFKEVTLIYKDIFRKGTEYQLSISNLKDCSGNSFSSSLPLLFKTSQPPPPVPERADSARIFITEIFADPSPEVNLPLVEFIEIFNPSKDTIDLERWSLNDPTTKATIQNQKILPNEYIILCPTADTIHFKSYGKTIAINPWPSLNNNSDQIVLKSFKNRVVDSVSYFDTWYRSSLKKPGGWSIERIDLKSRCEGPFNWTASIDTNGGTPGKINSVNISGYDLLELKADSLRLLSDSTIKLYFNKHLNAASLIGENFSLTPANAVKKITTDLIFREVILFFDKKFQSGSEYKLLLYRVKDCSSNSIKGSQLLEFKTPQPPTPIPERIDTARIVITEIFADPSPEIGLPLAEFIELYNPGSDNADLDKWILSDTGTKATITNTTIKPGEYLILCPIADTLLYKQFGKIKGISPWPILGNAGDQIVLKSFKHRLVDSLAFSDKWYKNQKKKNGGWSLEKVDLLFNSCNGFYNWTSSIDPAGGTPGRANSSNRPGSSKVPIEIDSIGYTSDSTVTLHFNSIADTFFLKPAHFRINNDAGKAIALTADEGYMKIHLEFDSKFKEGIKYSLTADSLFNCIGKRTKEPNNQASFTIPIVPELDYPLYINEILADPSPQLGLPEVEFVELYNPTEKAVSLKGMSYGDENLEFKFTSGEIPAQSFLILCPEKEIPHFSTFGKVIGLPLWPSLANEKDVLILKNNKGREFQRVTYNTGWYKDADKKSGGYSLEMINPLSICSGSQNWGSSKDPAGGTPGKQNSIYNNSPGEPLKLIEVVLKDSITLLMTFNKAVDSLSASRSYNYHINNGLGSPEYALPLSPAFKQVELKLKKPPTAGNTNKIELKDIRDCMGSHIATASDYGEFIRTEKIVKNAILLSEILFNPRPGGVDFIEIYNNTPHTLDLQDLSFAVVTKDTLGPLRQISTKQILFEPGQYMCITSDPEIVKKDYKIEDPNRIFKAILPSLNNDRGTVVLLSKGTIVDELTYTDKMHFQLFKNFEGISLERSSFKLNTNETGNFRSATAASGFATPGYKNSQHTEDHFDNDEFSLVSRTFSPDNDGFEDLLQVSYRMPSPGMVANIKIFNDKGILIKSLFKNTTLNAEGLIVWDGLNEFNTTAASGIYFIFAEIFDTNGNLKRFRNSFALAIRL